MTYLKTALRLTLTLMIMTLPVTATYAEEGTTTVVPPPVVEQQEATPATPAVADSVQDPIGPAAIPAPVPVKPQPQAPEGVPPPAAAPTTAPSADTTKATTPVSTQKVVAKVVWIRGTLEATSTGVDSKTRTLKKYDPIYLDDTLKTDGASKAQIVFTDDSLMTFVPSTQFVVRDYNFDPKGQSGSYIMNLLEGGFRTITGLIAKAHPQEYKIITPVATIGVRGTDFSIYLGKDGQLYMARYKGTPCVTNTKGNSSQTLCLDETTDQYAEVPTDGSAPVPVKDRPAAFEEKSEIDGVTFIGLVPPGGGTGGGIITNFCIE